jgi:hypothetical protein
VQQLEAGRKRYLAGHLQAGASYRIVDNRAIDRGRFRVDNDLGGAGHPARRANAGISSRKHNRNPRSSCPANSGSELKKGKSKTRTGGFIESTPPTKLWKPLHRKGI